MIEEFKKSREGDQEEAKEPVPQKRRED